MSSQSSIHFGPLEKAHRSQVHPQYRHPRASGVYDLPNELWYLIASFLPETDILRLRGVNKAFLSAALDVLLNTLCLTVLPNGTWPSNLDRVKNRLELHMRIENTRRCKNLIISPWFERAAPEIPPQLWDARYPRSPLTDPVLILDHENNSEAVRQQCFRTIDSLTSSVSLDIRPVVEHNMLGRLLMDDERCSYLDIAWMKFSAQLVHLALTFTHPSQMLTFLPLNEDCTCKQLEFFKVTFAHCTINLPLDHLNNTPEIIERAFGRLATLFHGSSRLKCLEIMQTEKLGVDAAALLPSSPSLLPHLKAVRLVGVHLYRSTLSVERFFNSYGLQLSKLDIETTDFLPQCMNLTSLSVSIRTSRSISQDLERLRTVSPKLRSLSLCINGSIIRQLSSTVLSSADQLDVLEIDCGVIDVKTIILLADALPNLGKLDMKTGFIMVGGVPRGADFMERDDEKPKQDLIKDLMTLNPEVLGRWKLRDLRVERPHTEKKHLVRLSRCLKEFISACADRFRADVELELA